MSPFSKEMHSRYKTVIHSQIHPLLNNQGGSQQTPLPISMHEFSKPLHEMPQRTALSFVTQPLDWVPAPWSHHLPENKSTWWGPVSPRSGLTSHGGPVTWGRDNLPWLVFSWESDILETYWEAGVTESKNRSPETRDLQVSTQDPNCACFLFGKMGKSTLSFFWGLNDCT